MLDFMNPERAGRRALVCLVRKWSAYAVATPNLTPLSLPSLGVSSLDLGRLWQRRRPFFLCAPPSFSGSFGAQSKVPGPHEAALRAYLENCKIQFWINHSAQVRGG